MPCYPKSALLYVYVLAYAHSKERGRSTAALSFPQHAHHTTGSLGLCTQQGERKVYCSFEFPTARSSYNWQAKPGDRNIKGKRREKVKATGSKSAQAAHACVHQTITA